MHRHGPSGAVKPVNVCNDKYYIGRIDGPYERIE